VTPRDFLRRAFSRDVKVCPSCRLSTISKLHWTLQLKGADEVEVKVWDEAWPPDKFLINQVVPRAQIEVIYDGLGKLLWPKTVES
jgi:hypothetical protein